MACNVKLHEGIAQHEMQLEYEDRHSMKHRALRR